MLVDLVDAIQKDEYRKMFYFNICRKSYNKFQFDEKKSETRYGMGQSISIIPSLFDNPALPSSSSQ